MNNNNLTIVSLHRPYHSPLWIAKWVCEYVRFYVSRFDKKKINRAKFFIWYVYRLRTLYAKNGEINEYVSRKTIDDVCEYLDQFKSDAQRENLLDDVMHTKRITEMERHIYSVYKASTYAVNLAEDKLGLVLGKKLTSAGEQLHLCRTPNTKIAKKDKVIFLRQILEKDYYFFVPYCLLQTYRREGIEPDEAIFEFSEKYYPVTRFDYTHCSHDNYTKVRKQWINQLTILTATNRLQNWVKNEIISIDSSLYENVIAQVVEFVGIRKRLINKKNELDDFFRAYKSLLNTSEGSGYVNLYDIMFTMHKGYERFNSLLQLYYDERSRKENIFLINIIATMDVRKRFTVRGKPVMKIKIQKKL